MYFWLLLFFLQNQFIFIFLTSKGLLQKSKALSFGNTRKKHSGSVIRTPKNRSYIYITDVLMIFPFFKLMFCSLFVVIRHLTHLTVVGSYV